MKIHFFIVYSVPVPVPGSVWERTGDEVGMFLAKGWIVRSGGTGTVAEFGSQRWSVGALCYRAYVELGAVRYLAPVL